MNWLKQISRLIACFFVVALMPRNALALVDEADPFIPQLIPIELQAWWLPDFGHIHAGTRLPLGQEVSGRLEFDVRIVLHNNPSHLTNLRIDADTGIIKSIPLDLSCPYDGVNSNTCVFNVPVSLDTTLLQDGWRELRLRATTETPDGQSFLNSSGIRLDIQNGGVPNDVSYGDRCDYQSLTGRGWYGVFEYTNVDIECVPQSPISGTHTFRVRAQEPSQHLTVVLDKTHFIPAVGPWPAQEANPGTLLYDEDGDFQSFLPITLDTTLLADGWHTLAVVSTGPFGSSSDCDYCDPGTTNFPSGVAKIWFYVQNLPPTNQPPYVDAGDDQAILLGTSATLAGSVYDDGLPTPIVTAEWLVDSGPGSVTFADPSAIQTSASFSAPGVYVLSLTLDDGQLSTTDTIDVVVNSLAHEESRSGGSADTASVSTAGSLSGAEGFYVASIATKPHAEVTSLSGLGLSWSPLQSQCAARGQTGVSVWTADGVPASGGSVTALLGKAPQNAVISVSRYSGSVSLGRVLSGNTIGIDGSCSGGTDTSGYDFEMLPATGDGTLVFSATATRQAAHAPGATYTVRDRLINGTGGSAAGIATQDTSASSIENIVVDGTFGWELDWAVVAFELHGNAAPPPPNADPTAAFGFACNNLDCSFTDGSSDSDGTVVSWSWIFGDGNGSSTQIPNHRYAAGGTYSVTLTVTDNDSAINSASQLVTVTEPSLPPAAPTDLTASVESTGRGKKKVVTGVTLNWTDNADDEDAFVIERCEQTGKGKNKTCEFDLIATVGANVTAFSDSPGSGRFKYRVMANNTNGNSAYSNEAKI